MSPVGTEGGDGGEDGVERRNVWMSGGSPEAGQGVHVCTWAFVRVCARVCRSGARPQCPRPPTQQPMPRPQASSGPFPVWQ